jgi:hypothetical protein
MAVPYRESTTAQRPVATLTFPSEARYESKGQKIGGAVAILLVFPLVGLLIGAVVGGKEGPTYGLVVSFGVAVLILVATRLFRRQGNPGIVIRVDNERLTIARRAAGEVLAEAAIHDLLDVTIETKALARLPEVRMPSFGTARGAGYGEWSKILFVLEDRDEPVPLAAEDLLEPPTSEELRKIRLFLRAEGWLPLDERGDDA